MISRITSRSLQSNYVTPILHQVSPKPSQTSLSASEVRAQTIAMLEANLDTNVKTDFTASPAPSPSPSPSPQVLNKSDNVTRYDAEKTHRQSTVSAVQVQAKKQLSSLYSRSKKMRKRLSISTTSATSTRRRVSQLWSSNSSPTNDIHDMFELVDAVSEPKYDGVSSDTNGRRKHNNNYRSYYTQELKNLKKHHQSSGKKKRKHPKNRSSFLTGEDLDRRDAYDGSSKESLSDSGSEVSKPRERYKPVDKHMDNQITLSVTQDISYAEERTPKVSNVAPGDNASEASTGSTTNLKSHTSAGSPDLKDNETESLNHKLKNGHRRTFLMPPGDLSNTFEFLPKVLAVSELEIPLATAYVSDEEGLSIVSSDTSGTQGSFSHDDKHISNQRQAEELEQDIKHSESEPSEFSFVSSGSFAAVYSKPRHDKDETRPHTKVDEYLKDNAGIGSNVDIAAKGQDKDKDKEALNQHFDDNMWRSKPKLRNSQERVSNGHGKRGGSISSLFSSSGSHGKSPEYSYSGSSDLLTELSPIMFDQMIPSRKATISTPEERTLPPTPLPPRRAEEHFITQSEILRIENEEKEQWKSKKKPRSGRPRINLGHNEGHNTLETKVNTYPISPVTSPVVREKYMPSHPASRGSVGSISNTSYTLAPIEKGKWTEALATPTTKHDFEWDDIDANLDNIHATFNSWEQEKVRREIEEMLDTWA